MSASLTSLTGIKENSAPLPVCQRGWTTTTITKSSAASAPRAAMRAIVSEIKWSELNGNRRQRDAASVLEAAVDLSASRELHIDVLVWNGQARDHLDRLRAGRGNREVIHLQMMYRFLFLQVISRWRRVEGATAPFWTLAPDRHTGLDFPALQREVRRDAEIAVDTTIEVKDVKETLNYSIQLADLLAGMAAYSHENWEYYGIWSRRGKQPNLQLPVSQWPTRFRFSTSSPNSARIVTWA